jgi:hypothetical protein
VRVNWIALGGLTSAGLAAILSGQPASALDTVQEKSSVEQTTITGSPTVIQHIDSKMEPTVVQSRVSKNPETGENEKVVEPIIMERHDKVLDTTILQPQVNEIRKTTEQVTTSKATYRAPALRKSTMIYRSRPKHVAQKRSSGIHSIAYRARHDATTSAAVKQITQTTEIERQPMVKETIIKPAPESLAPAEPQVIQKTETK